MAIKRVVDLSGSKQRVYLVIRAVRNDGTEFVKIWQGRCVRRVVWVAWHRIDKQTRRRRIAWSPSAIERAVDLNDGKQRVYLVVRAVRNDGTDFVKIWQGRSVRRVMQIAWRRIDKQTRRRRALWSPEADAYMLANYTSMPKRALAVILRKKFSRPFTKNSVISRHYNLKGKYHE